jgi:hypothetical protein
MTRSLERGLKKLPPLYRAAVAWRRDVAAAHPVFAAPSWRAVVNAFVSGAFLREGKRGYSIPR